MATTAAIGYGATLAGSSHTTTGQIDRLAFTGITVDDVEVSNMASTGAAKEFIPGMIDYGSMEMDLVFEGVEMQALVTTLAARTPQTWTITLNDTGDATYSAVGYINSLSVDAPHGDKISASVSIKCTGVGVFGA